MFYKNNRVERILREYPQTRSDDRKLMLKVWESYGLYLSESQQQKFMGHNIPSTETIRRTRQRLQEQGLYTPSLTKINERKTLADNTKQAIGQEKQAAMFDEALGRKMRRIIL